MVENIDIPSFGAGFGAGIGTSFIAYRAWQSIQKFRNQEGPARVAEVRPLRQVDRGYQNALIELAQTSHLFGHKLPLTDMLIEPRFMRVEDLVSIPEEGEDEPVFNMVPRVHDYPFLHAPYNIPTISLETIGKGSRTLVMVGMPGSGRTTALMAIALYSIGMVEFKQPVDIVQEEINKLESDLTPEQLAERVKNRIALSEQARKQYLNTIGEKVQFGEQVELDEDGVPITVEEQDTEDPRDAVSPLRRLAPLYVHLSNVQPETGEYGRKIDPAEPLLRGLQAEVGWFTSKRMVSNLYKLIKANNALILIDGFDAIAEEERQPILGWLKAFIEMYGRNRIIIAAPPQGYGLFTEMGATPIYLRPWNEQMVADHLQQWEKQWGRISTKPIYLDHIELENEDATLAHAMNLVTIDNRGLPAIDIGLNTWAKLEGRFEDLESDQMQQYLLDVFPTAQDTLPELLRLARTQLDEGYITLDRIVEIALAKAIEERGLAAPQTGSPNAAAEDALDEALNEIGVDDLLEEGDELRDLATSTDEKPAKKNKEEQQIEQEIAKLKRDITQKQRKLLQQLVKANVLIPYRHERFQFRYAYMTAYLGAMTLVDADPLVVLEKKRMPSWKAAICYLAQMRDIDMLVAENLTAQPDVLYSDILEITRWLRYAGENVEWRNNLLKYLGNLMVAPHQFMLLRERIAAALVSSRDTGPLLIFRRAMQDRNPDIRRIGVLGVGAMHDEPAVDGLADRALQDPDPGVQISSALALGVIGTQYALEIMVETLELSNSQDVRRAIAESLAANREAGYMTLYDAVRAENMLVRRAGVFGLSRIPTDWALLAINERYLEDEEWYVRSAAGVVFQESYEESQRGIIGYPDVEEAPWLLQWASEQVEAGNLSYEVKGRDVFLAALQQTQDPLIQLLALVTIGQIGVYDLTQATYENLRSRQEAIRDAAYRTLGQFQLRLGHSLPSPI